MHVCIISWIVEQKHKVWPIRLPHSLKCPAKIVKTTGQQCSQLVKYKLQIAKWFLLETAYLNLSHISRCYAVLAICIAVIKL